MDRVAGVGLSGAKETPGFRAIALQPRPPINARVTVHLLGLNESTESCHSPFGTNCRLDTPAAFMPDSPPGMPR